MIFGLWGEDKSCKTTLSLSFPRPLVHMEFDIGGFKRADRNFPHLPIHDWVEKGEIISEKYIVPFQMGSISPDNVVIPSKIIVGIKELFYKFAGSFIKHLQDDNVATIVIDTATLLYELTCTGYIQEKQELQLPLKPDGRGQDNKPLRTSLQPIEYREPYIRMRGFVYQAKAHDKNLVLTHHAADEYGMVRLRDGTLGEGKTGKRVRHGWQQLGDSVDVMVNTYWNKEKKKPYCKVELAEVKELEGIELEEPTYTEILRLINMVKGIV